MSTATATATGIEAAETESAPTKAALRIEGEMTIFRAAELKPLFWPLPAGTGPIDVDLAAVTEIDTTGVQLLLLAEREARAAGRCLQLIDMSAAVGEALDLLDLRAQFALATAA